MLINERLVTDVLNGLVSDIRKSQRAKNLYASGESADSLNVKVAKNRNGINGDIYGSAYFYQQQYGRKPGRNKKPPRILVEKIKKWVKIKHINIPAYAIAYKINRDGITVPNRYNVGGVLSDPLNPIAIKERLLPVIRTFYANELKQILFPNAK